MSALEEAFTEAEESEDPFPMSDLIYCVVCGDIKRLEKTLQGIKNREMSLAVNVLWFNGLREVTYERPEDYCSRKVWLGSEEVTGLIRRYYSAYRLSVNRSLN